MKTASIVKAATPDKLSDSWDDVLNAEVGHVFVDRHEDGLRFQIVRGPASLCAYVGVPASHPLAGKAYDDLPVNAHGGLTFSHAGDDKNRPAGWYWYGWDYAHAGDYAVYYDQPSLKGMYRHDNGHKWTVADVESDSWETRYDFKKLVALAEQIAAKP